MKLSKIGLILAGLYLFITAGVILYSFNCGEWFCGVVIVYPVFPEYLLLAVTGLFTSIADPINLLSYLGSVGINTVWFYFIGTFIFGGGYKNNRSKVTTVFMFILAALPIIIMFSMYVYGQVLNYNYDKLEKDLNTNQKAQISLAKNSNISIEPGNPTITKEKETDIYDEYKLVTPLKINNIPNELEKYNIQCKGGMLKKNYYITSMGNYGNYFNEYSDTKDNFNFYCGFLLARKNNESWQFGVDTWNRVYKNSPELVSYIVVKHGESLPEINLLDVFLYVPVKAEQIDPHAEPQGVSQEESTILNTNLKINLSSQETIPQQNKSDASPYTGVIIKAKKIQVGDNYRFTYEVINNSDVPIVGINIGVNNEGSPTLDFAPLGQTYANNYQTPSTSFTSPAGWEFDVMTEEELATNALMWDTPRASSNIKSGTKLSGFSVLVPSDDQNYLGTFMVIFNNGATATGNIIIDN